MNKLTIKVFWIWLYINKCFFIHFNSRFKVLQQSTHKMAGNRDIKQLTKRQLIVSRLNQDARTQKILASTMLADKNYFRVMKTESEISKKYGESMFARLENKEPNEFDHKLYFNKFYLEDQRKADLLEFGSEGKNYIKCTEIFQNETKHDIPVYKFFTIGEDENSRDFPELNKVVVEKTVDERGKSAHVAATDNESILTRM